MTEQRPDETQTERWTESRLRKLAANTLKDHALIVVSNREPYMTTLEHEHVKWIHPVSGLTAALEPIVAACGGAWIAHGSGLADELIADPAQPRIPVPPEAPSYFLRRVWLTEQQVSGYYDGFSNQGLWPLCHVTYARPVFEVEQWDAYRQVNQLFADEVLRELGERPGVVFIQDYHLALVPNMLRQRRPDLVLAHFWHVPWPNHEVFRICPWTDELLEGLLANDLIGFHIRYHCNNFIETVDRALESRVDWGRYTVDRGGHQTVVRPFPISTDFDAVSAAAESPAVLAEMARLERDWRLADKLIGFGLDRLDYTKGIPDRLRALDRLFEQWPEYRRRLVFVQAGAPSRSNVERYQKLQEEITLLVDDMNRRWGDDAWKPVIYVDENLPQDTLLAARRLAHFAMVNSLHDGMNLVAKEFVASRNDEDGVLILSRFTGSARELTDAVLVNPYFVQSITDAMRTALEMPQPERARRMRRMRRIVAERNVYAWAAEILQELSHLMPGE